MSLSSQIERERQAAQLTDRINWNILTFIDFLKRNTLTKKECKRMFASLNFEMSDKIINRIVAGEIKDCENHILFAPLCQLLRQPHNIKAIKKVEQIILSCPQWLPTLIGIVKNGKAYQQHRQALYAFRPSQTTKPTTSLCIDQLALQLIESSVALNPMSIKKNFFIQLMQEIKQSGLSEQVLQNARRDGPRDKILFYKRFGNNKNSRAAKLIANLELLVSAIEINKPAQPQVHQASQPQREIEERQKIEERQTQLITEARSLPKTKVRYDLQGRLLCETDQGYCSFDLIGNRNNDFKGFLCKNRPDLEEQVDIWLNSDELCSVINLQEEIEMHVRLISRVIQKHMQEDQHFWLQIRTKVYKAINQRMLNHYQNALTQFVNVDTNVINFEGINTYLDRQRPKLSHFAIQQLIAQIEKNTDLTFEDLHSLVDEIEQHEYESTTALEKDYVRTDNQNRKAILITPTPNTAHNKCLGEDTAALRIIHRNKYDPQTSEISACKRQIKQARVPSIAVKSAPSNDSIEDTAEKFAWIYQQMADASGHHNEPIVYDLLTSLHGPLKDLFIDSGLGGLFGSSNRQRLSAERIFKGVHRYNRLHLNKKIYIQNIPINQHTYELGFLDSLFSDDIAAEATLMTDLAILYNLTQQSLHLPQTAINLIDDLYQASNQLYQSFLTSNHSSGLFYASREGKLLQTLVNSYRAKSILQMPTFSKTSDDIVELASKALYRLYFGKCHWQKRYGTLMQVLSVFTQPVSFAGCKSANERYQMVAGRVEVLHNIEEKTVFTDVESQLVQTLKDFVEQDEATPSDLQKALDKAYNHAAYGMATVFSLHCQGSGAKIERTKNKSDPGDASGGDTNHVETGYVTRLRQKKAGRNQMHKMGKKGPNASVASAIHAAIDESEKPVRRVKLSS